MIKEEAKQIRKKILKQIDSLGLKVNPVQRLELAKKHVSAIKDLSVDAVYIYVLNDLLVDLEELYSTGKYTHEKQESKNIAYKAQTYTQQELSQLQTEVHKIVGNGEVMQLFNKLQGINAG